MCKNDDGVGERGDTFDGLIAKSVDGVSHPEDWEATAALATPIDRHAKRDAAMGNPSILCGCTRRW
ncbi:MAG: hypothetical protein AAGF97_06890 [Planctomycetota bacterium]